MLNRTILMGRLTADPELKQTPNGVSVCTFSVAIDRSYSKDREKQTDFIDVVAWREKAEFVSKYFSKGRMIIVEGSIQTRSYEDKNGNKRRAVEVVADNVQFGESKNNAGQAATPPQGAQVGYSVDYSTGEVGDFSEMPEYSDDLPF